MSAPAVIVALVAVPIIIGGVLIYVAYRVYRGRARFLQGDVERQSLAGEGGSQSQKPIHLRKIGPTEDFHHLTEHSKAYLARNPILSRDSLKSQHGVKEECGSIAQYFESRQQEPPHLDAKFSRAKLYGGSSVQRGRFPIRVSTEVATPQSSNITEQDDPRTNVGGIEDEVGAKTWTNYEKCKLPVRNQYRTLESCGFSVDKDQISMLQSPNGNFGSGPYFPRSSTVLDSPRYGGLGIPQAEVAESIAYQNGDSKTNEAKTIEDKSTSIEVPMPPIPFENSRRGLDLEPIPAFGTERNDNRSAKNSYINNVTLPSGGSNEENKKQNKDQHQDKSVYIDGSSFNTMGKGVYADIPSQSLARTNSGDRQVVENNIQAFSRRSSNRSVLNPFVRRSTEQTREDDVVEQQINTTKVQRPGVLKELTWMES